MNQSVKVDLVSAGGRIDRLSAGAPAGIRTLSKQQSSAPVGNQGLQLLPMSSQVRKRTIVSNVLRKPAVVKGSGRR
jgi:hypothetical protein